MTEDPLSEKKTYLHDALGAQINTFETKRRTNRKKAFWSKILATSFSTLTTILLGLQGLHNPLLTNVKNIALFFSACVTVLAAWEAFFNHRELWVRYTVTLSGLRGVQAELSYLLAGNPNPPEAKLDELFNRFQSILSETNTSWLELRKQQSAKGGG